MRERDLFNAALNIKDPTERDAFLDEQCREEVRLADRLRAMLEYQEGDDDFLSEERLQPHELDLSAIGVYEGATIGKYKLLKEIGEGGFGIVFMAEQTEPVQRTVALKVIKPGMDTRQVIARFEAERQALAVMDHPHISRVLDAGSTDEGRPYFVMELVDGCPITSFCDEHELTLEQRVALLIKVCQAVQHAHQKGIIHRDIKPSNVLVRMRGGTADPQVIDFGVAKAIDQKLTERTLFTRTSQIIGTPQYMSPEQAGQTEVDTRTDIYSLGVLLYELLTGSPPLETAKLQTAAYDEVCRIIREENPPPPSSKLNNLGPDSGRIGQLRSIDSHRLRRLVRGELDWITIKSLSKNRERRYETVDAMQKDLQRYLDREPVAAGPPSQWYRLEKFIQRNRKLAASLAVTVLAIALVASLSVVGVVRERYHARIAAEQSRTAAIGEFEALLNGAFAAAGSRKQGQQRKGLADVKRAKAISDRLGFTDRRASELRSASIACLAYPDLTAVDRWDFVGIKAERESFDKALRTFSFVDRDDTVVVQQVGGAEVARFENKSYVRKTTLSPNGRFLVSQLVNQTTVFDVENRNAILKYDTNLAPGWQFQAFSRDGDRFATATFANRRDDAESSKNRRIHAARVFELPSGRQVAEIESPQRIIHVNLSDDGRRLAVSHAVDDEQVASLRVYDVTSRETVHTYSVKSLATATPMVASDWHPQDPDVMAFTVADKVVVRNMRTQQPLTVLEGHRGMITDVKYHPSGKLLLTTGYDDVTGVWDAHGGRRLLWATGKFRQINRKGTLVGFENSPDMGIWQFHTGGAFTGLQKVEQREETQFFEVHPAGRLAVSGGIEVLRFWDLENARIIHEERYKNITFRHAKFTGDGSSLWISTEPHLLWNWPIAKKITQAKKVTHDAGAPQKIVQWNIGPPTHASFANHWSVKFSSDGTKIAWRSAPEGGRERVFDSLSREMSPEIKLTTRNQSAVDLSPDGKWLAVATHHGEIAEVYATSSGQRVLQLSRLGLRGKFSDEGDLLVFSSTLDKAGLTFVEVGTWKVEEVKLGFAISHPDICFSHDGKVLAFAKRDPACVVLMDTNTRQVMAELRRKQWTHKVRPVAFTADNTRIVAGIGRADLGIWDLRFVRKELTNMGLDWPHPALLEANNEAELLPMRVEVDWGDHPIRRN